MNNFELLGSGGFGFTVNVDKAFMDMVNATLSQTAQELFINNQLVVKIFKGLPGAREDYNHEVAQLERARLAGVASYFIGGQIFTKPDKSYETDKFYFKACNQYDSIRMKTGKLHCIFMQKLEPVSKDTQNNFILMKQHLYNEIKNLHANHLYHMDIKPDNIMKMQGKYTLIDYGLATMKLTHLVGTVYYMSPALIYNFREEISRTSKRIPFGTDKMNKLYNQTYEYMYRERRNSYLSSELRQVSIESFIHIGKKQLEDKEILEKNDEFALALSLEWIFDIKDGNYDQGGGKSSSSAPTRAQANSSSREQSMLNSSSKSSPKTSRKSLKTSRDKATSSRSSKFIII